MKRWWSRHRYVAYATASIMAAVAVFTEACKWGCAQIGRPYDDPREMCGKAPPPPR